MRRRPDPAIYAVPLRSSMRVEDRIYVAENELDLHHEGEFAQEASLFIDAKFLEAAYIVGDCHRPHLAFGAEAWAGYLYIRRHLQIVSLWELTPKRLQSLHSLFVWYDNQSVAGKFRPEPGGRGGLFEGDRFLPLQLAPSQVAALDRNPWVCFEPEAGATLPHQGYIRYLAISMRRGKSISTKPAD